MEQPAPTPNAPGPQGNAPSAQELAQARKMVEQVLNNWDFETWDQVLAPDVQVDLKIGTVGADASGQPTPIGTDLQAKGRDDAKKVLKQIYGDLKKNVNVTGQVAYGYEVMMFGDLNVKNPQGTPASLPIACYMHFNPQGQIDKLTVATVDTRPLAMPSQPSGR